MAAAATSRIKYDNALIKLMSFFESVTRAKLKDCFVDSSGLLVYVVEPAQFGLAVGRAGSNVKRLETALKRKIKIVEYSDDILSFVASLVLPIRARNISFADGVVTVAADSQSRGYLIGRGGSSLRNYESIIRRYFPIKELRVV